MKNITEMFVNKNESYSVDEKLEALHDTIETLANNQMNTTIEVLFDIVCGRLNESDMIVNKFKQYAKEFKINL